MWFYCISYPRANAVLNHLPDEATVTACSRRVGEGLVQVPFAMDAAMVAHSIPGEPILEL